MRDKISIDRLAKLHPKAREVFKAFIEECEETHNITLRISQGLRTFAEQNALYAQGRNGDTKPRVTDAIAGSSFHNYGLAVDLVHMDGKVANWNYNMKNLAPIALKHKLVWGGTFKRLYDGPHFEYPLSNIAGLRALHASGRVDAQGYVIL